MLVLGCVHIVGSLSAAAQRMASNSRVAPLFFALLLRLPLAMHYTLHRVVLSGYP